MDTDALFRSLLLLSRAEQFDSIRLLPGAGVRSQVVQIATSGRGALKDFFSKLDPADRESFFKAVAVFENAVGGIGSVTVLQHIESLLSPSDHHAFDWVLSNTCSYSYYALGATSYAEILERRQAKNINRGNEPSWEEVRAAKVRERRAALATANLYNSVRRGDKKAVVALLKRGANPESTTPDGVSLYQYAVSIGRIEIAALLNDKSTDLGT